MFPSKYKPEYCELLLELTAQGKSVCHFCMHLKIARSTFYDWVECHIEFREAFDISREISEAYLTDIGMAGMVGMQEGESFNATIWSMLMRNKCGYVEHRRVAINFTKCNTALEKQKELDKQIALGGLTPSEIKHFSDYVMACLKAEENEELRARLEKLEAEAGV